MGVWHLKKLIFRRVFAPIPMVEEPYFSIHAEVQPLVVPTVSETPAANVASPSTTISEQAASPCMLSDP
jgi:hypothetical protein